MRATQPAVMDVIDFGRELVETRDLDPVYVALWGAKLPPGKLRRFLLAYWCFYHCGTAAWIVDRPTNHYWNAMLGAAESVNYPRGTERRHFRGEAGINSVRWLMGFPGGVDYLFSAFTEGVQPKSLRSVVGYVKTWVGFGDWIAFKVADMLERLEICSVDFDDADSEVYASPQEGARLVVEKYRPGGIMQLTSPSDQLIWAFDYLWAHLGELKAPPRYERKVNVQEFETILCKWKSHLDGNYQPGKDIEELRHGLLRFAKCPTAQLLLRQI